MLIRKVHNLIVTFIERMYGYIVVNRDVDGLLIKEGFYKVPSL